MNKQLEVGDVLYYLPPFGSPSKIIISRVTATQAIGTRWSGDEVRFNRKPFGKTYEERGNSGKFWQLETPQIKEKHEFIEKSAQISFFFSCKFSDYKVTSAQLDRILEVINEIKTNGNS